MRRWGWLIPGGPGAPKCCDRNTGSGAPSPLQSLSIFLGARGLGSVKGGSPDLLAAPVAEGTAVCSKVTLAAVGSAG